MAASERLCDICETRDITVFATDWCPECEQSLCELCKSYHSASKLSKTHETIPFESFDKLPCAVKEIKNDCSEHGARFEYYCSQHEVPCCVECMKTTHAECRHLTPLHKVVENYKTSNALSDFEQTLTDFLNNINSLIHGRFDNKSLLADKKEICLKEIADTKRNVIAHLDQLEIKLKAEVEMLHEEHLHAIEETIQKFELLKTDVAKMQEEAHIIKQYASDFQLFIAVRDLEHTSIETILPSLGNVNVITKESDIKLVNKREKQAQLSAIVTPCIGKIQLKPLLQNIQLPSGNKTDLVIHDNCFLSNERLVFTDKLNKRLIILKDNGEHEKNIPLLFMPNAIAVISDTQAAVSGYSCKAITIIGIESAAVDHSFKMDGNIFSLSFRKERFLILVDGIGFCITDVEGNLINKIPYSHSDTLFAILLDDRIYFSHWKKIKWSVVI
ncbi:unnamed protein product [Mytilus edulis]|uniref:B box-type domain-containing protein n=1 Tax=Mytilus edulis TaxID=6550 RepID=A0A8S3QNM8_MYTED|nr:unnamed protein product [Mytilus edulis]